MDPIVVQGSHIEEASYDSTEDSDSDENDQLDNDQQCGINGHALVVS